MIKFFRKIRQKLLSENKFSKYLIYAIGEIALVVIGILIALQINNQNEARKAKVLEIELIRLLITDLEEKKEENISDLKYSDGIIKRSQGVVDMWVYEEKIDTTHLKRNLRTLGMDNYFQNQSSPIYAGLSSTNFWKQLPDSLTKKIDNVYRVRLKRVGIAFDKLTEYGTFCRLNFLAPNDLIDLDRDTDELLEKIKPVKEEYILNSKLFISSAERLRTRLESSAKEIEGLIKSLRQYNEQRK